MGMMTHQEKDECEVETPCSTPQLLSSSEPQLLSSSGQQLLTLAPQQTRSPFDTLLTALSDCEEPDSTVVPLEEWAAKHGVNNDVIIHPQDNRGSPLLIACECDLPAACRTLLRMRADANYRHPGGHGNSPLLRCAEVGYDKILEVLLSQPELNVSELTTKEYKLVLSQNIPQYEAGGRSALLLAVEATRPECVALLLRHAASEILLKSRDSFGRTPLEAAFEVAATKPEGSQPRRDADEICYAVCKAAGLDFESCRGKFLTDKETALARERKRQKELRRRFLTKSHLKRIGEVQRGLAAVNAGYTQLRLYPEIFVPDFPEDTLLINGKNQHEQWSKWLQEPVPGTFSFPLLTREHCSKIYNELMHYEKIAQSRPELGLPLYVRHDGNMGQLESCGFDPILRAIEAVWRPLVKHLWPSKGDCELYHAFLTRNWVGRDENATFKIHCDKSDLTLNLCLHASDDLQGSTVGFYNDRSGEGSAGSAPEEVDRVYTHKHRVGNAIMHDGEQFHKTDAITCGTRCSLILWARRVGLPCSSCGAAIGATWLFCKACGHEVPGR
mmetsp:Transcript_37620/g.58732  ORF Transcript_37620/g.58732 Transcript_37620/m.58732 type:complete len:557 (-) Transcript_37620:65-1735(-)